MSTVLALDQGTTSSRAILFNDAGTPLHVAQQEFPQLFPAPGHVEHDPEAIWSSQVATARSIVDSANSQGLNIASLGIANQRETVVLWERKTGKPVANAIVWQSRITAPRCEQLKADGLAQLIHQKTGLVIDAYFSASKIEYLLDSVPGLRARAERGEICCGTVDAFLIFRLTNGRVHATDVSNASRTQLFNIHTLQWDDELLNLFRVPREMLPEIKSSSEVFGETDPEILGQSLPIGSAIGDQQAATFGQACFTPGSAKNTYGTGCFMLLNIGQQPQLCQNGILTTVGWKIGNDITYCLEGSVFVAGAAIQWLRDGLGVIRSSSDVEQLQRSVDDTGGVYFVPAFVGLGTPYWDPSARGTILGITRGTTTAHLVRAAVEAMAYQSQDVLATMQRESGIQLHQLKVDGGATVNNSLLQFQADILNVPVLRPRIQETTALGAAYLAGLSTGVWKSISEISGQWALDREFTPQRSEADRQRLIHDWNRAIAHARGWIEHDIAK